MVNHLNSQTRNKYIHLILFVLCCVVLVVCSVVTLNQKEGLFRDEYYSYGCSNSLSKKSIPVKNGIEYTREEVQDLAVETFGAKEDTRFRFDIVWDNLSGNVHPPVFYALLHLVCSLMPGVFSLWQAAAVNIFCGLIGLYFAQKLIRGVVRNEWLAGLLCLCFVCTQGLYAILVYLRDYSLAMCACFMVTWEIWRFLHGNRKIRDLVKIGAASVLCALSHYYCLIYLFFLCGTLCVILITQKNWKSIVGVVAAELCAAAAAIGIFPPIISHLLTSSRGTQAVSNLSKLNLSQYIKKLKTNFSSINAAFFGRLAIFIAILFVILMIITLLKRKQLPGGSAPFSSVEDVLLLLVPLGCYCLVITKLEPTSQFRYLFPVTGLFPLAVTALLLLAGHAVNRKVLIGLMSVLLVCTSVLSWRTGQFEYLYQGQNATLEKYLSPYQDYAAVQIWSKNKGKANITLPHMKYFSSITYCLPPDEENLANLPPLQDGRDTIVLVGDKDQSVTEKLLQLYPGYTMTPVGPDKVNLNNQEWYYYLFRKE